MTQSVSRLEAESGVTFEPAKVDLDKATNVLDRWIAAASRNLTTYVRQVRVYRLRVLCVSVVGF